MKTKAIVLSLLLAAVAATAACDNTIRGVGRDVERSGEAIQRAPR